MNRLSLFKRFSSALNGSNKIILEQLSHREIVQVKGPEVAQFMQGLITNDINHLAEGHMPSMYTMFLNTRGRVMYDGIVYSTQNPDTYLIECDSESAQILQKHLKMYRIRRKIDVEALGSEYKIWVLFDKTSVNELSKPLTILRQQFACPCADPKEPVSKQHEFHVVRDPRLAALGLRFITQKNYNSEDITKILGLPEDVANKPECTYRMHRYRLGIGEGCKDLPPESCFPLEANGDYLHAVSFNKGCYLGQELTARTYHTGVIRKRLMPLYLENELPATNVNDEAINISNEAKTPVGKLRGVDGTNGLALLRIAPALAAEKLDVNGVVSKTQKPEWWPKEGKTI
ncbi:putative transferase CAF17 homolog, mitochondrial [Ctenocephalides felis]|uniref:putative transferase CAF17 homolog, mitochondrial n=1 Tax=Ctenocephalides felis TaxID=7515 RepID=UPI000E6E3E80|nr:putative transferase CAF17 homolog, mitochondrial [Ctenocephalides felis]